MGGRAFSAGFAEVRVSCTTTRCGRTGRHRAWHGRAWRGKGAQGGPRLSKAGQIRGMYHSSPPPIRHPSCAPPPTHLDIHGAAAPHKAIRHHAIKGRVRPVLRS